MSFIRIPAAQLLELHFTKLLKRHITTLDQQALWWTRRGGLHAFEICAASNQLDWDLFDPISCLNASKFTA